MDNNYIVDGNIYKALIKLSLPVFIAFVIHMSYHFVDTIFVARLGAEYVAALAYVTPILFIIFAIAQGLGIGATALVAQHVGARNKKKAANIAEHSLLLSIILSIVFTVPILIFQKSIFIAMGATPNLLAITSKYSSWVFGAFGVVFIGFISGAILRGAGDMKTPMISMGISAVINIILDPLLIFGIGPFPAMGITGAAIATVLARTFQVVYICYFLLSKKSKLRLNLRFFKFDYHIFSKIVAVGLPASIASGIRSLGMTFIMGIVSGYGAMAVAAWGIIFKVEGFIFLPLISIGTAAITMIGQNLGAGKIARAQKIAKVSILIGTISVFFIGLILFIFPKFFITIFVPDLAVIKFGVMYFTMIAFTYPLMGIYFVGVAILQGSGHLKPVIVAEILRWGIVLGFGYGLSKLILSDVRNFYFLIIIASIITPLYILYIILKGDWAKAVIKN